MMHILSLIFATLLQTQEPVTPEMPSVEGWPVFRSSELQPRGGNYKTEFIGLKVDYRHPEYPGETIRVYFRQVGLVSERPREDSKDPNLGRSTLMTDTSRNFHMLWQGESIERAQKNMDVFAVVRTLTVRDERLDLDVPVVQETWLIDASGVKAYLKSDKLGALKEISLTEPLKEKPEEDVVVGMIYRLGSAIHVIRVDQDDLETPKTKKNQKGEEKNAR